MFFYSLFRNEVFFVSYLTFELYSSKIIFQIFTGQYKFDEIYHLNRVNRRVEKI